MLKSGELQRRSVGRPQPGSKVVESNAVEGGERVVQVEGRGKSSESGLNSREASRAETNLPLPEGGLEFDEVLALGAVVVDWLVHTASTTERIVDALSYMNGHGAVDQQRLEQLQQRGPNPTSRANAQRLES